MSSPGFSHILVPLDGTPSSELALEAAARAASQNGKVTIVQVAEDLVSPHQLPDDCDKQAFWQEQARPVLEYLEKAKALVTRDDLKVETMAGSGNPAEAILDIAKELAVEAIAMSSHSRSMLRQVLLGSTVQTVMARAAVPLLIVHPATEELG